MSKKFISLAALLVFLLALTTACSSDDDKKDSSKKSEKTRTTSAKSSNADFVDDYNAVCDSLDQNALDDFDSLDYDTVSASEFEDAYDKLIEQYNDLKDQFYDIDVPSKMADDWEEFLDAGDEQGDVIDQLKTTFLDLIEVRDLLSEAEANNDAAAIADYQTQIEAINDELTDLTEQGDDLEEVQDDFRDKYDLDQCIDR